MTEYNRGSNRHIIDKAGDVVTRSASDIPLSERPLSWWLLYMPGTVIMWFEYMFPNQLSGTFGTARRRNIPFFQIAYSLGFYAVVIFIGLVLIVGSFH